VSLKRVLGPVDAAWLVAGNMIGSGIFITPGFVFGHLPGAWWALAAWLAGGLLALSGAAVYGELGARIPRAGGDYQYLRAGLGPLWGFLTGWGAFTLTFSAAAAAACNAAVGFVQTVLPEAWRGAWGTAVLGPLLVLLLTVANVLGARVSGRTTVLLTAAPLTGLAGMALWGLLAGDVELSWPVGEVDTSARALPLAFGAAMLPVFFTYSGWNVAAYLAGEVRDAGRNIPRGLLLGTAAVTLVYLVVNALLLSVVPADRLAGTNIPGVLAVQRLLGSGAGGAFSIAVALAILGSANVTLMAGARVYYAMAVDGYAPKALRSVNRAGVPHVALWAGGIWSAVLAATGTVERLVAWTTLAILLLSALTVVSLFVMRRRMAAESPYRCPGYPVTPLVYLATTLAVAVASTLYDPRSALFGILLLAAGIPVYIMVRSRAGLGSRESR
jgi:APA family basic amino acid/polyamine antiporter